MYNSKLTKIERDLIDLFFILCPEWRKIIIKQISYSTLQREKTASNYSIYFKNHVKSNKLKIKTKMPIEIILGNVDVPAESALQTINGCSVVSSSVLSVLDKDAVGVRMYFIDGTLTELEVYTVCGKEFDGHIDKNICTYVVHDESIIKNQSREKKMTGYDFLSK